MTCRVEKPYHRLLEACMVKMLTDLALKDAGHILAILIAIAMAMIAYWRHRPVGGKSSNWMVYAVSAAVATIVAVATFAAPSHLSRLVIAVVLGCTALAVAFIPMYRLDFGKVNSTQFVIGSIGALSCALVAIALSFWEYAYPGQDHPSIRGALGIVLVFMVIFALLGVLHGLHTAKDASMKQSNLPRT